jgi:moderate conductance mechanosensitive channel
MKESFIEAAVRMWHNLGVVAVSGVRIVVILLLAWLFILVSRRALGALRARVASRLDDGEAVKRAETLNRVFRHTVTVVISLIAFVAVLSEVGVSVAPILGAAGVVGLAVGFGAQSLVKDYVTGLLLLIENQIRQGDVVQIAEFSGSVEEVTLRYVRLRDYSGNVYFIPNGTISTVINMSRGFSHAVIDIGVAYSADLDEVMDVMRSVGAELRQDPKFAAQILQDLDIAGVQDWAESAVMIRARFQVVASQQWAVRREYLRRLKHAFDRHGIEIPFPQRMLHQPASRAPKTVTEHAGGADAAAESSDGISASPGA